MRFGNVIDAIRYERTEAYLTSREELRLAEIESMRQIERVAAFAPPPYEGPSSRILHLRTVLQTTPETGPPRPCG